MKSQRGQSLVEFALVLPVLILILLGTLDLSRVFQAKLTVTNAAREGARVGMNAPRGDLATYATMVKNQAIREAANSGIALTSGDITVTCLKTSTGTTYACSDTTNITQGDQVRVQIAYRFYMVSTELLGVGSFYVSGSATMVITN